MFSDKRLLTSRKGPRDSGIGYREVFYVFVDPETRYPRPDTLHLSLMWQATIGESMA
jgi:hypothetical protein